MDPKNNNPPISNVEVNQSNKTTQQTSNSLKSQLEQIFSDFDKENRGRIVSKDLPFMIELFEKNQTKCLLEEDARQKFQLFCEQNPNMEVSVDDLLQLIAKLTPSAPSNCEQVTRGGSITKLGVIRSAPMLSAPETNNDESYPPSSRRRFYKTYNDGISDDFTETSFEASGGIDQSISHLSQTMDDPAQQLSRLHRHTMDLTKRLKDSERHLASVARQHEDRIEELQHKLDETKTDLQSKKREIQDYKSNEKISSHQISALEGEIQKIQKSLLDQKQLYSQLKKQYEEQCEEADKLRDFIKLKEEELLKTEKHLDFLAIEERKWSEERKRLENAITKLEEGAASSQHSEIELEQQRMENLHLKETIDKLKLDLDEIRSGRTNNHINRGETLDLSDIGTSKDLQSEMIDHALASIDENGEDLNTEDVRNDKKHKLRRRKDENSDINAIDEHAQSRSNNDHRVTDIEQTGRKQNGPRSSHRPVDQSVVTHNNPHAGAQTQVQILSSELGAQYALIEGILRNRISNRNPHGNIQDKRDRAIRNNVEGDNNENSRHKTPKNRRGKRKVNSSQEIEAQALEKSDTQQSKALVTRNANNSAHNTAIVHNTATFALYTVVIYLFGIITSVFVIDNNQGPAPYSDWMPYDDLREDGWASRLGQMILYWAEILLNDGNMRVPT